MSPFSFSDDGASDGHLGAVTTLPSAPPALNIVTLNDSSAYTDDAYHKVGVGVFCYFLSLSLD